MALSDNQIKVEIDGHTFIATLEQGKSPETCAAFLDTLPFESQIVHVRWSGEGVWIPLGNKNYNLGFEDATSYPNPGQILLYPKGISETEIIIAYGHVQFASKAGVLAGNHFATINNDLEKLKEIGISTLWQGAKTIKFIR